MFYKKYHSKISLIPLTLHNGNCVKENCCSLVPDNADPVYENEQPEGDFKYLCEGIVLSESTSYTPDQPHCCMENGTYTPQIINGHITAPDCETRTRSTCDKSPYCKWDPTCPQDTTVTFTEDVIVGFVCKTGYHLEGCNCVKNGPKTITITCNATVDTRQSSNGCTSSTWTETTYTASDNLPFTVYIAQNLYEKGIKSRNGCDATYHQQGVTYVANHIINAGNRVSTWRGAKFNSSVSWDNEVGYDGKVSYGVSTISKSSDLSAGLVEITSPVTTITDTVNGQEYVINLVDCAGGGDPSPVYAKCGLAQEGTYTTPPDASLLCKKGEYSIPQNEGGKWTWTCTNGNSVAECRANVGSSQTLKCGTQKWTCIGGDVANKQGPKWNCVNGTQSICCSYLCTPKTYSCPSGYRLTSDNKCELYMQFCVDDICGTEIDNHMCTSSRDTSNCASKTCFGDATQAANGGSYCDWGRDTLEYSEDMSSHYNNGNSFVGWMATPGGNGVRGYKMVEYNYKAESNHCGASNTNYYSTDQILKKCPTLTSARSLYGGFDNGYYIDSEMCPSIPKFDACEEGGGDCTVNEVANALCDGGGLVDPPSPYVCTDACDQCYDTFGECMANKPNSATSNCVLGTPSSALESQCYCYRPAATVPVCWL